MVGFVSVMRVCMSGLSCVCVCLVCHVCVLHVCVYVQSRMTVRHTTVDHVDVCVWMNVYACMCVDECVCMHVC